jgi:hypothetical protein
MKTTINNFILVALLMVSVSSCVKLDTAPYDRETDLVYWEQDPNAALNALNTCYTYIASMDETMYADCMSDNAYTKVPSAENQKIGNGSFSTDDSYVLSVWDSRYAGIRLCNQVLANIDRVPSLSAELKQRYIGEAKVLRAYHYYELYTRFGDIPYFTNVLSIKESSSIARTEKATVVSNIISELEEVINGNYLPASYDADNKGRITKWAAMAIEAKVYLFEGNWAKVQEITSKIMQQGGFTLFPSYSGLFEIANEYNSEVIMDAQYRPTTREHHIMYAFLPPSLGGYSQLSPLQSLVDSYIMLNGKAITADGSGFDESHPYANRDPRLAATVMYTGNSYRLANGTDVVINCEKGQGRDGYGVTSDCSATGYYVKKYWDNTYRASLYSGLNPILIRYADILLMNAEALAEQGTLNETAWNNTIKLIRQRAGFTQSSAIDFPAGSTKDALINIVRNERRSELAMEGLRYKDIIRWKIADKVMNGYCHGLKTGDVVNADNGYIRVENRTFNAEKHYLWPIPQSERDLNKNLTQNPNW